MTFRYPDKPTPSGPGVLADLPDGEWLAQMKSDGFRCLVDWNGDCPTFTSRERLPIPASVDLGADVIAALDGLPPLTLDAEWMGRRDRQPEGLVVFDLLVMEGRWLGEKSAGQRFADLLTLWGRVKAPPTVRLVEWAGRGYPAFFKLSKTRPGVEGIVLKHDTSRYIGSVRRSVDNPLWLKCKWRGGEDGQTRLA